MVVHSFCRQDRLADRKGPPVAQFIITEFPRGSRKANAQWEFSTRAEAEAFRDAKVAEGNESVSYQLAHRDRPAGLANLLRRQ